MNKQRQQAINTNAKQRKQLCQPASQTYVHVGARRWVRQVARAMAVFLVSQSVLSVLPAFAQSAQPTLPISASTSAPSGQRPLLDAANNGVPIVHIAPPSAGGVSRNQYDQFNVNQQGLILNNSTTNVQTQLGGWITNNLQLGATPARIILNEVVGANPSQLRGTIEVAGQRADIVVANPNGITCDGCGFLNTGRASLSTGAPQFGSDGSLRGFDVRQGQLTVGGNGLNAANIEQLDLIARGIVIEGEVWAKNLNAIAGANQVLYGTLQATAQAGSGSAPSFAIDIKDLGGMYANQVYLVSTEQGLGVNSTGRMAALQGNLVLSANGDLTLKDSYAKQNIQINGSGNIRLAGQTQSEGGTTISAAGTLDNQGVIDSQGALNLAGSTLDNAGTIAQRNVDGATLNASGGVGNAGSIYSGGTLNVTGGSITDTNGSLQAAGDVRLKAGSIDLVDTRITADANAQLNAGNSLSSLRTNMRASADVNVSAGSGINITDSTWQSGRDIGLQGAAVSNRNSMALANGDLNVTASGAMENIGGELLAAGNLTLAAQSLDNTRGEIASDATTVIHSGGTLNNGGGVISGKAGLVVDAGGLNNGGGTLISDAALTIRSSELINTGGTVLGGDAVTISTGRLNNDKAGLVQGVIASTAAGISVKATQTSNVGGLITAAGGGSINTQSLDNTGGELSSGAQLAIDTNGQALVNDGGALLAGGNLVLRAGAISSNALPAAAGGKVAGIAAGTDVDIQGTSFSNDGASIAAGRDITLALGNGALSSNGGAIEAGRNLAINAGAIDSSAGRMIANSSVTIRAASVNTTDGVISAADAVTLDSSGALTNIRGRITSNRNVGITATTLDNTSGVISAGESADVRLGAGLLNNTQGQLIGSQALAVQSGEIRNSAGTIATGSALALDTQNQTLDNTGGQIVAGGDLSVKSARFANDSGIAASINGALDINTQGQNLGNAGGKLQAQGDVKLASGAFGNQSGLISGQQIDANTAAFNNDSGQIVAGGGLTISSTVLSNDRGLLQAMGDVAIDTQGQSLTNTNSGNNGGIVAGALLSISAGSVDNRAGFIASNGSQTITVAGNLDNRASGSGAGQIVSNADSRVIAANVLNNGGRINALGNLTISTGTLDNRAGQIATGGDTSLSLASLDNSTQNGVGGTIDANNISATSTAVNNVGGAIRSAMDTTLGTAVLINTVGTISAKRNLAVNATSFANGGGSLVGDNAVTLTTSSQSFGGTIASANNVTLNVNGDYNNSGLLSAQKNLTVNANNIVNSGTLTAGDTLTANTGNLTNSGDISADTTNLNVTGTLTNTSTGLIDGFYTNINAGTTNNTGRIYGDVLRIKGNTVNNSGSGTIAARNTLLIGAQYVNNTDGGLIYSLGDIGFGGGLDAAGQAQGTMRSVVNASSTIEAGRNLSIASDNILNRNDKLTTTTVWETPVYTEKVQPAGSASIYDRSLCYGMGGGQDDNGCIVHPDKYGQRSTILPARSQNCVATGDWTFTCTTISNYQWDSPAFAQFGVAPPASAPPVAPYSDCDTPPGDYGWFSHYNSAACSQWRTDYAAWDVTFQAALDMLAPKIDAYNAQVNEDNRIDHFEDYTWYKVTSTSSHSEVVNTAPGKILSGGNMSLTGALTNLDSQIVAGSALAISGPAPVNQATMGVNRTDYSGTTQFTHVESCGTFGDDHCREWNSVNPYNPAPDVTMTPLPTVRYEAWVGNQATSRNLTVTTAAADHSAASAIAVATGNRRGLIGQTMQVALTNGISAASAPPVIVRVAATGSGARANDVIVTTPAALTVPQNSLFQLHAEPGARYLVETDPRFTNYRTFLSSDYFLQALKRDPERELKRYGDGFTEQKLINDQVLALTGRRYLSGYSSTEAEYQGLMDAGVAFAQQYQLTPGVALTAEQMALLTTDIVWMVERDVTLPDGSTQRVLVPQVYLRRPADQDLQPSGALIAANDVLIQTPDSLVNSGTISGNTVTALAGGDIVNQGGRISGQDILMHANNDLKNLSGVIAGTGADSTVTLLAGRDIVLQTQTLKTSNIDGTSSRTNVQRIATVQGGDIRLDAGRDLVAQGASVSADQNLIATAGRDITVSAVAGEYRLNVQDSSGHSVQGRTGYIQEEATKHQTADFKAGNLAALSAAGDVTLRGANLATAGDVLVQGSNVRIESVTDRVATDIQTIGRKNYDRVAREEETLVGGSVNAGGNVTVLANGTQPGKGDITLTGAYVSADKGQVALVANNDITISNGTTRHTAIDESYSLSGNALSKTATTKSSSTLSKLAEGTTIAGNTVIAQAGHDLAVQGSAVVADGGVTLSAVNNVNIAAATSTSTEKRLTKVQENGFLSGGGFGISYGQRITTTDQDQNGTTQSGQSRSMVGSNNGNLSINAGNAIKVSGSDIAAVQDVDLTAKSVTIDPGRDTTDSKLVTKMQQDGLTLAIGGTVVTTAQTMETVGSAAGKTGNSRVKAMAAATAAMAAANAAKDIAANGASVSISLTAGHSESEQTQINATSDSTGSTVMAGNNLNIKAVGGGKDSNINVIGSDLGAKNNVNLVADNQINLLAAQDLESQHSQSKSMSAAAGIAASYSTNGGAAIGVTGGASLGRGHEDGEGVTQRNSHVSAGNNLTLQSGSDTNVKGAVISGSQVTADIGGDLNIESLQDTAKFDSKNQNISASATVGYGANVSGSYNQSNIHSDYASVQEQSGILAGDGGFAINVKGNTDLKGGVISSSQAAVDASRNSLITATLTQSDIQNHAEYDASSVGLSGGVTIGGGDGKGTEGKGAEGKSDPRGQGQGPGGTNLIDVGKSGSAMNLPVAMGASDSEGSVTKSGISGAAIVISDGAQQQAKTGKNAEQTIASINREVTTGIDTSGRIGNNFNKEEIEAGFAVVGAFSREVGTYLQLSAAEADAKKRAAEDPKLTLTVEERRQLLSEAKEIEDNWGPNGTYRQIATGLVAAASGNVAGSNSQFAQAALVNYVQQQGSSYIGKLVADGILKEGSPEHAALHAIVACAGAAASSQNCSDGAVGGAASSLLTNLFKENPDETNVDKENKRNIVTSLVAGIATAGGSTNVATSVNAATAAVDNNWLTKDERKQEKVLTAACYSGRNPQACTLLGNLKFKDQQRNQELAKANEALKEIKGEAANKLANELRNAQELVCGSAGPMDCTKNADWVSLEKVRSYAQTRAQGLEAVYPEEWALNAVAGVGLTVSALRLAGRLAAREVVVVAGDAAKIAPTKGGAATAYDDAKIANNFYRDGQNAEIGQQTFSQAALSSTHNANASEVVLGKYIAGSSNSYEAVAQSRGATYFSMSDWGTVEGQLGADQMWNINKAFLDQQMAQGKTFLFTGNPANANVGSFTHLEFKYLQENGYRIIPDKSGFYRAIK